MIAGAIVLAILLLLCFIRIGIDAEFSEDGLIAGAFIGPVVVSILPFKKKVQIKKKQKSAKPAAAKPGRLDSLKKEWREILKAVSRFRHRLLIKELTIYYMAAGNDPSVTAMSFGAASIGLGLLVPVLENNFKIKNRDFRTAVNFEASEPYVYVRARLSLAVWQIAYFVLGLLKTIVISTNSRPKIRKAVK